VGQGVIFDLRQQLYAHLQRLSFSFYDRHRTGELMSRVTQDVEVLRRFWSFALPNIILNAVTLAAVLALMLTVHWRLTLLTLSVVPWVTLVLVHFSRRVRPAFAAIQDRLATLTAVLEENVSGSRIVRAFTGEAAERRRFAAANAGFMEQNVLAIRLWAFYFPFINFVTAVAVAVLIGYGGYEVIAGRLTLGYLIAFHVYLQMLLVPLRMVGWLANLTSRAAAASQRIFELLDTEPEIRVPARPRAVGRLRGHVRFERVSFGYADGRLVLREVDLDIAPGERVLVLGPTGSGKTTAMLLLGRFYDPTAGCVRIDGFDLRSLVPADLRRQVAFVFQETLLFSASIRDNIAFAKPQATQAEIEMAARCAGIHDFIVTLPAGYDERIGERGVGLSGGQKQRLAIARALLADPAILVLDDATASVDAETEREIHQALSRALAGRTLFIITQRPQAVPDVDRVIVFNQGRVVEDRRYPAADRLRAGRG
ncbi:MAG TPA: ABC transporter ATP-binding protein, partial [Bacillota bacterium]